MAQDFGMAQCKRAAWFGKLAYQVYDANIVVHNQCRTKKYKKKTNNNLYRFSFFISLYLLSSQKAAENCYRYIEITFNISKQIRIAC